MSSIIKSEELESGSNLDIVPLFETSSVLAQIIPDSQQEDLKSNMSSFFSSAGAGDANPEANAEPGEAVEIDTEDPAFHILQKVFSNRYVDTKDAYNEYRIILNNLFQNARESAYQEGKEQAQSEVNARIENAETQSRSVVETTSAQAEVLNAKLAKSISQLVDLNTQLKHQVQVEGLELAIELAQCILQKELSVHPEWAIDLAKKQVQTLAGSGSISISVHPNQLEDFRAFREDLLSAADGIREIIFKPDESIEFGDVIIEHQEGKIDSGLRKQIIALKEHVTGQ